MREEEEGGESGDDCVAKGGREGHGEGKNEGGEGVPADEGGAPTE